MQKMQTNTADEYVAVRSAGKLGNCIFMSWEDAAAHLAADLQGARYKVFRSLAEAESYLRDGRTKRGTKRKSPVATAAVLEMDQEAEEDYDENQFLGHGFGDSEDDSDVGGITAAVPKALFGASSYKPTKKWEMMLRKLVDTAIDGKLPEDFKDPKLKAWVKKQHVEYNKLLREEQSAMSEEKMDRLARIGFVFKRESATEQERLGWSLNFDLMMDKLHEFRKEYGDCRVMRSHVEHRDLFNWTVRVRKEYQKLSSVEESHKCRLSATQLQRLTDIGFLFRQKDSYKNWEDWMSDLLAYQAAGNDVNAISTSHPMLGGFVARMRKEYKFYLDGQRSSMTRDRVEALENIGFDWNLERRRDKATLARPKTWDVRYGELLDYRQQYGDTCVPQQMDGGLGHWVKSQRQALKLFLNGEKSSLNAEKVARLTAIGFIVDAKDYRKRQKQETTAIAAFDYDSPFSQTNASLDRFRS